MSELEHLIFYIQQTKKRKLELEVKKENKTMNRKEMFELDMCNGDLKRAYEYLKQLKPSSVEKVDE